MRSRSVVVTFTIRVTGRTPTRTCRLCRPRSIEAYSGNIITGVMVPNPGLIKYTTGADIVVTPSNKGQLHELNYFLRLVTVTV